MLYSHPQIRGDVVMENVNRIEKIKTYLYSPQDE